MSKRLLIVGKINSVYIQDLYNHMLAYYNHIDIIDITNCFFLEHESRQTIDILNKYRTKIWTINFLNKIIKLFIVKKFLRKLNRYDCLSIHYIDPVYGFLFVNDVKRLGKKVTASVWGDDFHKGNSLIKKFQKRIYNLSDAITFNNDSVLKEFSVYYKMKYDHKLRIIRFGLSSLEYIKNVKLSKEKLSKYFNIPENSFVITCGYNGNPDQNHELIIQELSLVKEHMPRETVVILPMSYCATPDYIIKIETLLKVTGYKFLIIKEFLTHEEMAYIRCLTDVFVNVQKNDSFSASMQEHLYAGSLVVNGAWLPYESLKKEGVYFLEVEQIGDLGKILVELTLKYIQMKKKCFKNSEIIWNLSSWPSNIEEWRSLI